jgi:hypothetical protein
MKGHVELSPELDLLAQCCRWNFRGGDRREVAPLNGVDWSRVLRHARFHRVQGLAWRALSAFDGCPTDIADALSADACRIAAANLEAAAECRRLLGRFTAAEIPLVFLKGLTLGALAYGSPDAKSSIDIDLLIRPEDLVESAGLLRELGYEAVIPGAGAALVRWHRLRKESVWARRRLRTAVDLHTRLADNPRLILGVDVNSPRQLINIGNKIALPTLAPQELFAYVAVHGAWSAWFRLKWISDFAGFLSSLMPAQIMRFYVRATNIGAGRATGQALLLSETLFGALEQLPALRDELHADRPVRRLHAAALKRVAGSKDPVEPTSKPLGTLAIHLTEFMLHPGARFKFSELLRQVRVILP